MLLNRFTLVYKFIFTVFTFGLLGLLISCKSDTYFSSEVKIVELKDFETFVSVEDNTLAAPSIIRYGGDSNLFIFDEGKGRVLKLNANTNIVKEYGRRGRGPGEFMRVINMFLAGDYFYTIDKAQYRISKFDIEDSLSSTMSYGTKGGSPPPPPFSSSEIHANDINNEPFVTINGNIFLSTQKKTKNVKFLYELVDWEGNHISDIGKVPNGSEFVINFDKYKLAIKNHDIPAFYKPNAFPVNNLANSKEYYLVYSAFPKIIKYNSSGQKLWETDVIKNAELDSISSAFYNTSDQLSGTSRVGLRYYISGVSNKDGDLYLALNSFSNALWIHHFDSTGKLIHRYKVVSEDANLLPIFDIDFVNRRFFVVTKIGEIRTYQY